MNLNGLIEPLEQIPDADEDKTVLGATDAATTTETNDRLPVDKLFKTPIVDGEVPSPIQEYEISADRHEALESLIRIAAEIRHRNAISQEDIAQIESAKPGFISEENPIGLYTRQPSQTQLKESLSQVDALIEKDYDDLRLSLKELVENYVKNNSDTPKLIQSKYTSCVCTFNKTYAQLLHASGVSDLCQLGIILDDGTRLSKVLKTKLYEYINCEKSITSPLLKDYLARFDKELGESGVLQNVDLLRSTSGECLYISNVPYSIVEGEEGSISLDKLTRMPECRYTSTIDSVLAFLLSPMCRSLVHKLVVVYSTNIDYIKTAQRQAEDIQSESTPTAIKVQKLLTAIADINSAIALNRGICIVLNDLYTLYSVHLDLVDKLLTTVAVKVSTDSTVATGAVVTQ